jgi:hypothetical protein
MSFGALPPRTGRKHSRHWASARGEVSPATDMHPFGLQAAARLSIVAAN